MIEGKLTGVKAPTIKLPLPVLRAVAALMELGAKVTGKRPQLDRSQVDAFDLRGLDRSTRGGDVARDGVEPRLGPPRDEDPCALPGEYPRHSAANSATASVDYCISLDAA